MSTAHRPTWDPAQARDVKGGSRQFSVRDMAAHTKLKFRLACSNSINFCSTDNTSEITKSQSGQTSVDEVKKRDLRIELLAAEHEARNKKRKAEGLPPLEDSTSSVSVPTPPLDEEASKRRKILQEALELDKDDEDDDEGGDGEANDKGGR
jgi:protein CWC15